MCIELMVDFTSTTMSVGIEIETPSLYSPDQAMFVLETNNESAGIECIFRSQVIRSSIRQQRVATCTTYSMSLVDVCLDRSESKSLLHC
jgi:hypothetical protein